MVQEISLGFQEPRQAQVGLKPWIPQSFSKPKRQIQRVAREEHQVGSASHSSVSRSQP